MFAVPDEPSFDYCKSCLVVVRAVLVRLAVVVVESHEMRFSPVHMGFLVDAGNLSC